PASCQIPLLAPVGEAVLPEAGGTAPIAAACVEPPQVDTYRGPLVRCSSYSGLTRHEEAGAHDRDPEHHGERAEPGLLGDLGMSGARLGDQVHSILEDVLGNRRSVEQAAGRLGQPWQTAVET